MFQFADFLIPLLRAWPWDIARGIIRVCSLSTWQNQNPLYAPLVDYLQVAKTQGINIIVTGHSLGGGMASIGAALTGLKSVGISPPGIKLSSLKFGIQDMYSLDESMISIYAK
jgi:putative lipase involved disintegration of autophagic bodies